MHTLLRAVIALTFVTVAAPAFAQYATPCDSCESCTEALSRTGGRAELSADIVSEGEGPCIVIKGQQAQLDGLEHDIRMIGAKATAAVRVEADDVLVKNLHVGGADTGVDVVGAARVTLFHLAVEANQKGISAERTTGLRVTRSIVRGAPVGISFGSSNAGSCPRTRKMENLHAVVTGTHIEGAKVGIAACDAMPVLKNNVIVKNEVGVSLVKPDPSGEGGKAAAPFDPCVCKPELPSAKAGTALFFSSGCHGCQVHEAWLPELRDNGHDILMRATGQENAQAAREFDAFIDRCAPQVTDAIGIPGCVPNYVCLANDLTNKVRKGESALDREVEVGTKDQLAAYEQQCQAAAKRNYGAAVGCVAHQLHDNVICGNTGTDIVATAGLEQWAGIDNACATTDGYVDAGAKGCTRECPASLPAAVIPESRQREGADVPAGVVAQPTAPAPAPAPTAEAKAAPAESPAATTAAGAPVAAPAPAPAATAVTTAPEAKAEGTSRWTVILAALGLLVLVVGVIWFRWDSQQAS